MDFSLLKRILSRITCTTSTALGSRFKNGKVTKERKKEYSDHGVKSRNLLQRDQDGMQPRHMMYDIHK